MIKILDGVRKRKMQKKRKNNHPEGAFFNYKFISSPSKLDIAANLLQAVLLGNHKGNFL